MPTFLSLLDLLGTFVFALSGAAAGIRHRVDLFGVLVLSFVASNAGGMTRDVLIGAVPPAALTDWRYLGVAALAGILTFVWRPDVDRLQQRVVLFDAAGLALVAVSGAHKALAFHIDPVIAAVLGMVAGIGGGVTRDVLLSEIPAVFRSEVYAVAALAGATVVILGELAGVHAGAAMIAGACVCFGLRVVAIRRKWRLPIAVAREVEESAERRDS
jgi:uncharacterized membrane protein YeiH